MTAPKKRTIGVLLKSKFSDATHDELVESFTAKFNLPPPGELTDEMLRIRLCNAYSLNPAPEEGGALPSQHKSQGQGPSINPPGHNDPTPAPTLMVGVPRETPLGPIPNLTLGKGKWGGRVRLVTFHAKPGSKQETQPLWCNCVYWCAPLGQMLEVPYPFWNVANNCKLWDTGSDDVSEFIKQKDGRLLKVTTPRAQETVFYTDHGDKPGTEDLPDSLADFYQRAALKTHMFRNFKRPVLIMIHDALEVPRDSAPGESPPAGMTYFRDMKDEDIRIRIAQTLGTPFENMLQNELWDAATA